MNLLHITYNGPKSFQRRLRLSVPVLTLLLMLRVLTSCEEAFTPDVPHKPVLCINSLVTEGQPIEISVSKTRLYTDAQDLSKVDDVAVEIYANGQLQDEAYIPNQGDRIEIRAKSPTVGEAVAEVAVPLQNKYTDVKWEPFDLVCTGVDKNWIRLEFKLRVQLTIHDPDGEDYYSFSYHPIYSNLYPGEGGEGDEPQYNASHLPYYFNILNLQYDLEPIFSEHIGAFESLMGGEPDGFSFFSDHQFSGESYTLNLQFNNCMFLGSLDEMPVCCYGFDLNTLSPSYYNWMRYLWQKNDGTLSDMGEIGFGDPIWGYSNVSTRAGVVAAQTQYTLEIDFEDYITKQLEEITRIYE